MTGYLLHYSGVERLNLQVGGPGEEEEERGTRQEGGGERDKAGRGRKEGQEWEGGGWVYCILILHAHTCIYTLYMF